MEEKEKWKGEEMLQGRGPSMVKEVVRKKLGLLSESIF